MEQHLYWPQVLTRNFCYCSCTWAAQLPHKYFSWISPSSAGSGASVSICILCGVYFLPGTLKDQVMADVTQQSMYRNSCRCFRRTSALGIIFLNCWNIRICKILASGLQDFYLSSADRWQCLEESTPPSFKQNSEDGGRTLFWNTNTYLSYYMTSHILQKTVFLNPIHFLTLPC
jgi:hypothetical protein